MYEVDAMVDVQKDGEKGTGQENESFNIQECQLLK